MKALFDFNNLACRCVFRECPAGSASPHWGKVAFSLVMEVYEFISGIHEFLEEGEKLETIIALDWPHGYWRNSLYPKYKADRDKTREKSAFDWAEARKQFAILAQRIALCFPWFVLGAEKCEADDIIFALSRDTSEPVIIYSTDSDYLQLVDEHVSLYQPNHDDYVEFPRVCKIGGGEAWCETPKVYLQYAILTGQAGKDNVYNVKTPSNWDEACGKRKPGFGVAAAKKALTAPDLLDELARLGLLGNYRRNEQLIDMAFLPEEYHKHIKDAYSSYELAEANIEKFSEAYAWMPPDLDIERVNSELGIIAGVESLAACAVLCEDKEALQLYDL